MRKTFNLKDLQIQSKRNNFRRRQGLLNYEIPIFKKVKTNDLRGIISKKINKIGKFYEKFKQNKIPENLLPKENRNKAELVDKYWNWRQQKDFMRQKNIVQLLANTSADSKTNETKQEKNRVQLDSRFSGLPQVKSRLMFKHKGKVAKALKNQLDVVDQLRKEVSSDLELIQKENQVFGMNYEQAERNLATNIQHRHTR